MNLQCSAENLKKALKKLIVDKQQIIDEICSHSKLERIEIKRLYQKSYNKSLEEKLKKKLDGNFLQTLLGLLLPTYEFEVIVLKNSIESVMTDYNMSTDAIIQIICTKNASENNKLAIAYKKLYGEDLVENLDKTYKGNLGYLFKMMISGNIRNNSRVVDDELARQEAQQLYDAGIDQTTTNENIFMSIICFRSLPQLYVTCEYYYQIASQPLDKSIEKEMNGKLKCALLAVIKSNENVAKYYAEKLYHAILLMNHNHISRIIISRSEIDLSLIKIEFKNLYDITLEESLAKICFGSYKKLIFKLLEKETITEKIRKNVSFRN